MPFKVSFYTFGCRLNQAETQSLEEEFSRNGFLIVDSNQKTDFYIVNTCSVTARADKKSLIFLRKTRQENPKAKIAVIGCGVGALKNFKADLFITNKDKKNTLSIFKEKFLEDKIFSAKHSFKVSRTRAFIKIQDGCNSFCSYCIVPYLRGREKSHPTSEIIQEIKEKGKQSFKEIVLTGVNIGKYQNKLKVKNEKLKIVNLAGLIERILKETSIPRIRLGSLNPQDITDEFIELFAANKRLCPHLHLSLQSGSDKILKKMNRSYTPKEYEDICLKLKSKIPNLNLTTDIIVGFPGETEKDFKETLGFVEKVGFSKIHVFPYSPRKGTIALEMKPQINSKIKKERKKRLLGLSKNLEKNFYQKFIGQKKEVLFEGKKNGYWEGYTDNYLRAGIKSPINLKGRIKKVIID